MVGKSDIINLITRLTSSIPKIGNLDVFLSQEIYGETYLVIQNSDIMIGSSKIGQTRLMRMHQIQRL